MKPSSKPQDDSVLDFRNSKGNGGNVLAKSMMETPIPRIKDNISVKSNPQITQRSLFARSQISSNNPTAPYALDPTQQDSGDTTAEYVPTPVATIALLER